MNHHEHFYELLPSQTEESSWFESDKFVVFDDTWHLISVDIRGSTQAIESGRYKDVNMVGALCIIALLNETQTHDLPFVFGGDGATILVPNSLAKRAAVVLAGCSYRALESFDLHLRTGIVPLKLLFDRGETLQVMKYQPNEAFHQAIFQGSALQTFESGIKNGTFETITPANNTINLDGLECRWQDIQSPKDITLSLLVDACHNHTDIYPEVMDMINRYLGTTSQRNAIKHDRLHTSKNPFTLLTEIRAKNISYSNILSHLLENILGSALMYFGVRTTTVDWSHYKTDVIATTDAEKFDGGLKMVVSARNEDIVKVEAQLQKWHESGKLYYGIHKSSHALMTCLVYERNGAQIHFIDAADGGYAMAAKHLKNQKRNTTHEGT